MHRILKSVSVLIKDVIVVKQRWLYIELDPDIVYMSLHAV